MLRYSFLAAFIIDVYSSHSKASQQPPPPSHPVNARTVEFNMKESRSPASSFIIYPLTPAMGADKSAPIADSVNRYSYSSRINSTIDEQLYSTTQIFMSSPPSSYD